MKNKAHLGLVSHEAITIKHWRMHHKHTVRMNGRVEWQEQKVSLFIFSFSILNLTPVTDGLAYRSQMESASPVMRLQMEVKE